VRWPIQSICAVSKESCVRARGPYGKVPPSNRLPDQPHQALANSRAGVLTNSCAGVRSYGAEKNMRESSMWKGFGRVNARTQEERRS
jgi:hypothetical protein